jgi:hypothetical protein
MWEPRRLTPLWASTACYSDSFTFNLAPHMSDVEDVECEQLEFYEQSLAQGRCDCLAGACSALGLSLGHCIQIVTNEMLIKGLFISLQCCSVINRSKYRTAYPSSDKFNECSSRLFFLRGHIGNDVILNDFSI